jgi:hypothetical protein
MLDALSTIKARWAGYHAYLVAETESLTPTKHMFVARSYSLPWLAVLLAGIVLCLVLDVTFDLGQTGRIIVLAPFALVGLGGISYSGWVVIYYGVRADIRRLKEARTKGS